MRIGVVAPVWISVPPQGYGGVEQVVSLLVEELVARGHDVTLFASGDSITKATLRSVYDVAPTDLLWEVEPDAVHVGAAYTYATRAFRDGEGFDLIHDHTNYLGVAFAASLPTPVVHTVHMILDDARAAFLRRFSSEVYLTAISDYQRSLVPDLTWRGTVHNAVDVDAYPFRKEREETARIIRGPLSIFRAAAFRSAISRKAAAELTRKVISVRDEPANSASRAMTASTKASSGCARSSLARNSRLAAISKALSWLASIRAAQSLIARRMLSSSTLPIVEAV